MEFESIDIYLWQKQIFNYHIAKGFLTLKQLANFKIFSAEYQREINKEHKQKIINYLQNEKYRYLSDIIIMFREVDLSNIINTNNKTIFKDDNLGIKISQLKSCNILRLQLWQTQQIDAMLDKFKIVDGNHRLSAIKTITQENPNNEILNDYIGVTFILGDENSIKDELALFYYLNSKSKPLLPEDYLSNTLKNFENVEELNNIDWWLYVFKSSNDKILEIFNDFGLKLNESIIARACDYLAKNINNKELLNDFFAYLRDGVKSLTPYIKEFDTKRQFTEFICINFFIYKKLKNNKKVAIHKEIFYFCEWLLEDAKLDTFKDFENLYLVYQNTYILKNFKIFIAMEFQNNNNIYKAIKGTIDELSKDLKQKIEPLRIDRYRKGATYKIVDEIFNQIDERGLVIADITGKNANVYLEVGYTLALCRAKGIDNQLILLLKDEENKIDNNKVAFDLTGYKYIKYKDTEELREKLKNELEQYYKTKFISKRKIK